MAAPILSIDTQHDDMIHDAQMDFYGKKLATCSSDRTIKIYDVTGDQQEQEQMLTGHEGPVWQVAWAHPKFGVVLASCSYDGKVIVYREDKQVWSAIHTHSFHSSSVNSIAWAPAEYGVLSLACASADGKVSVITHSAAGGWACTHFQDSTLGCNAVSWGPYSSVGSHTESGPVQRLVTASCDNTVKMWKLEEGSEEWVKVDMGTQPHKDWVRDVAWAPSTGMPVNTIASCSEDHTVYIWTQTDADSPWSRELLHTFDSAVWRLSWSITGNVLAVSSGDHKVSLWKEALDKKWNQISSVDEAGALREGTPQ